METLEDIKAYITDMVAYCDVIGSKDSPTKSKMAFTRLMGNVAKRIAVKCEMLEEELKSVNAEQDK